MPTMTLPFPPSTNRLWRQWQGRTLLSREGRSYHAAVAHAALTGQTTRFGDVPLALSIDAWMPDLRRRDLDNLLKITQDSLCKAGLFGDDSQIVDLHIRRAGVDRARPRLECQLVAA